MRGLTCKATSAHGTALAHFYLRGWSVLESTGSQEGRFDWASSRPLTLLHSVSASNPPTNSFADLCCLSELAKTQNDDGGWGFRAGLRSAVEPTSWALLALCRPLTDRSLPHKKEAAVQFLQRAQLEDGAWPAVIGDNTSGWVTSLACLALGAAEGDSRSLKSGLKWLCVTWPGEGGVWWRVRHRLSRRSRLVDQDHRLRGWGWTPGTSSWVEPTAFALLALRHARGVGSFLARVEGRCDLGGRMLCNRMCPNGGWNCGNPFVYGAAGEPIIGPTCWALLGLGESVNRDQSHRCIREGLAWLERVHSRTEGPGSLALAHLCLKAFKQEPHSIDSQLANIYRKNQFLGHIPTFAWILLASQPTPRWLSPKHFRKS